MELYQENKRNARRKIDYPHSFTRKIKIKLQKELPLKLRKFTMNYKTDINGKTEVSLCK